MIALYAFWVLGEWKTTFAVFLFDQLDCKFAYRLFGSDGTTTIFTFLYANLRWYSHSSFIFVAMESQYSMLLGWMTLSILSAGWSWAAFSQLNVIIIIPESQTNKRFMKKQHIHVGMRAPITNKQVWGHPPQSFKAKRFEALPPSNFEKKRVPIVKFWCYPPKPLVIWYHVTSWETICWSSGLVSENPDDIPRVYGW